jgi:hypothetical protein
VCENTPQITFDDVFMLLLLSAVAVIFLILMTRFMRRNVLWRAAVTPLASIIGSGFLVLGPILVHHFGVWAPWIMLVLCMLAWGFGSVLRANIQRIGEGKKGAGQAADSQLENVSAWILSVAYMISVAYYLNLFGSFAVSLTQYDTQTTARWVTTCVYLTILVMGYWRGFRMLESVEYQAVAIKLAVIGALIFALGEFTWGAAEDNALVFPSADIGHWEALTLVFGLLITVQGFETSRYLGASYTAVTRIRSMKLAQVVAALIYLAYVILLTYSLPVPKNDISETEIISLMGQVSPFLPVLLVAAALAAQFSAAIADTGGAGGLLEEVSRKVFTERQGYLVVCIVGLILTWVADVFTIIVIASRAFAFYYAVQAYIAAHNAQGREKVLFASMSFTALAAALLGTSVET